MQSQQGGNRVIEYIAPLPVDRCAGRLQGRHEKRTFFAWDWQTRMTVDVARHGPTAVRFRLRRVDKNSWLAWGSMVEVRGVLQALGDSQTAVRAEVRWSLAWVLIQVVSFGFFGMAFVLAWYEAPLDTQLILRGILGGLIGLLVGMLFVWWWGGMHLRGMIGALKEATGHVESPFMAPDH